MTKLLVFWDVTLYRLTCRYECWGGTCCLHLQKEGRCQGVWKRINLKVQRRGTEKNRNN